MIQYLQAITGPWSEANSGRCGHLWMSISVSSRVIMHFSFNVVHHYLGCQFWSSTWHLVFSLDQSFMLNKKYQQKQNFSKKHKTRKKNWKNRPLKPGKWQKVKALLGYMRFSFGIYFSHIFMVILSLRRI